MQKTINVAQAFGLVGEPYDLTPFRADAYEVATNVTFGQPAGRKSTGEIGLMDSTYSTFAGFFFRPREAVSYGTSDGALKPTLAQPAGATVQVLSMGRIVLELEFSATQTTATASAGTKAEEEAKALALLKAVSGVVDGASAYIDTNGGTYKLTATSTSNTLIGKFFKGGDPVSAINTGATVTYSQTTSGSDTLTTAKVGVLVVVQLG